MALTDYTTFDEVRALLGVSDEEIGDETLALPIWSTKLDFALEEISETLQETLENISSTPEANRTAAQKKLLKVGNLYAAYSVASDLLVSLPMFGFERVTDGKAEIQRFDRWEDLRNGVAAGLQAMKVKLRLALATVDSAYNLPATIVPVRVVSTGLATDPVTGV